MYLLGFCSHGRVCHGSSSRRSIRNWLITLGLIIHSSSRAGHRLGRGAQRLLQLVVCTALHHLCVLQPLDQLHLLLLHGRYQGLRASSQHLLLADASLVVGTEHLKLAGALSFQPSLRLILLPLDVVGAILVPQLLVRLALLLRHEVLLRLALACLHPSALGLHERVLGRLPSHTTLVTSVSILGLRLPNRFPLAPVEILLGSELLLVRGASGHHLSCPLAGLFDLAPCLLLFLLQQSDTVG
mmetsp:Transcript_18874/g.45561  ORF Transcript_18874/g.45561 Transcript_18874/m.45561 type:complete len:242 (+) Transcript_18874:171-896(+)